MDFNECDDGSECTTGEKCFQGKCTVLKLFGGIDLCDDDEVCTKDICEDNKDCKHVLDEEKRWNHPGDKNEGQCWKCEELEDGTIVSVEQVGKHIDEYRSGIAGHLADCAKGNSWFGSVQCELSNLRKPEDQTIGSVTRFFCAAHPSAAR